MKRSLFLSALLLSLHLFFHLSVAAGQGQPSRQITAVLSSDSVATGQGQPRVASPSQGDYGDRPLSFEPNQGQAEGQVAFLSHGGDYTLFLTSQEVVFASQPRPTTAAHTEIDAARHPKRTRPAPPDAVRMRLVGANPHAAPIAADLLPGHSNYLTGSDATHWQTHIPNYAKVAYPSVYPGIDLVYYGNQHRLEYDFVLRPHADPTSIGVRFAGAKRVRIDRDGALHLGLARGELVWHRPVLYQDRNGKRQEISGGYRLCRDNAPGHGRTPLVRFTVGAYDPALPLVIDPSLAYSTFLGGSQSDTGRAIAIDAAGNAYVAGSTLSANFPTTAGATQRTFGGGDEDGDAFVTKFDHNGQVVFTTYFGGNDSDSARGIALAGSTICIAGETYSHNFPLTPSAFQSTPPLGDNTSVFVAALSADGSSLLYSTYLGGIVAESGGTNNYANDITTDSQGYLYITGYTDADFPTTTGALKTHGGLNGIVAKLDITKSGAASLVFSTLLGGDQNGDYDEGQQIRLDSSGNIYIAGYTYSFDYPTTPGAYETLNVTSSGSIAFLTKMNSTGTAIIFSTLFNGAVQSGGLALDNAGDAYMTGVTGSAFPTTAGAFQTTGPAGAACIFKFNPTGTALVYSTYLGKGGFGRAIAVEPATGIAYVTGNVNDAHFPTTPDAISGTYGGAGSDALGDVFLTKINAAGTALIYSTYLGGAGDDVAYGMAIDPYGDAYLTGSTGAHTGAPNFPTTNQTLFGGGTYDAFVTKISTARLTGLTVNPSSGPGGTAANPSVLTGQLTFDGHTAPADFAPLSSSNPAAASVSAAASLPETAIAQFPITLHPVAVDTNVTIGATFGGVTLTAPITVLAPRIASVVFTPSSVVGGENANGTVTLTGPAPAGGLTVTLTSGNPAATVPTTVTVPADASTATFVANTHAVSTATQITVTATSAADATGKSGNLTLNPPDITSLALNPTSVRGLQPSTGTVTISETASTGGIVVNLSSGNTAVATVPASVTVPSGSKTATFVVNTLAVAASTDVTITGTLGTSVRTPVLTVTPPTLDALSVSPTSVKGGSTSTGTVTISDSAPSGGITIALSSNKTAATVPATVTILSGAKTATFTITTSGVSTDTSVTITGTFNSQTQTASLTVQAPLLTTFALHPTVVRSLQTSTGTLTLDGPAPTGGISVNLFSANPSVATVPVSVLVPAGATSVNVTVNTSAVSADTRVLLAATLGTSNQSVTLTVQPHLPFDFNNDGHNDLIFQNLTTNLIVIWYTNALSVVGGDVVNYTPPTGWQVVGCADINHDGNPDLFLQNQTTGQINVWYMAGTAVVGGEALSQVPAAGYKVVGIGDFNGDGKPDILFQNASGQLAIWYLNGAVVTGGVLVPQVPSAGYNVVGVGDFNSDGKPDIVFQNQTNNQVVVWYMNGSLFAGGGAIAYVPPFGWQVLGVEDINGDGKADLVFQNQTTNQVLVWFMDGLNIPGGGTMSQSPDAGYKLRGPH